MKVLIIHNKYGVYSGEEAVVNMHIELLRKAGHKVISYNRNSSEIDKKIIRKILAFFTALYNPVSIRKIKNILKDFRPDIIHIHNLYPLISPAILPVIRKAGIPIVMTVHNYRLICPNGLLFNKKGICEACAGGREWNCIQYNCERSFPKSIGYSLRNISARLLRQYIDNVSAFLCLTDYQRKKLVENSFPADRCFVLPNFIEEVSLDIPGELSEKNGFVFLGRLNRQKGIDIILKAAELCPDIPFYLAGKPDESFVDISYLPRNVKWLGVIEKEEIDRLLKKMQALVFTSRSYEGFPMVFLEAMQHGIPVIAPRLAGNPEIIRDGYNGWLFDPEDVDDLVEKIRTVHENPETAMIYGSNGYKRLSNEYNSETWSNEYKKIVTSLLQ
ncbi:MAG: glycosyltransferase family 4 protein [Chlorobium sp.]|nr:MAG: glycosyltransferase family 4 protein [Chlorobium sp.]